MRIKEENNDAYANKRPRGQVYTFDKMKNETDMELKDRR
jgi:hypothetical protein